MDLLAYPRPPGDTGIGFHYFPDMDHYGQADLARWLPELKAMGASWLVMLSPLEEPISASFLAGLVGAGIEPVIRVYTPVVRSIPLDVLRRLLNTYRELGVHYVHVYNEPNLPVEWDAEEWMKPALVDRFMDYLIPCLEEIKAAGLIPLFTPLAPGGYYWDTAFLKTALDIIVLRGKTHLFEKMAVCIHNYAFNKPLDWGAGGAARWPDVRPYHTPAGSEDQIGFYLFEWYDEIIRARVGRSLPLICGECGARIGDNQHPGFPPIDESLHASRNVEISRQLMAGELPDYLFSTAFWLLANGDRNPFEDHAWYRRDGRQLPAVGGMKAMPKYPRGSRPEPPADDQPGDKPIYHYVLFPVFSWGISRDYFEVAFEYLRAFTPTCGFDPADAALAEHVTVIGSSRGVSDAVVADLVARGCKVDRVAGADAVETKEILDVLAERKQRFLNISTHAAHLPAMGSYHKGSIRGESEVRCVGPVSEGSLPWEGRG